MSNPEKAGNRTLAGKCLCGAVHYTVADEFVYAANCHCSNCRRATGSAFKAFAGIERDKLRVTKGEDSLMIFGDDNANDTRCGVCGSFLYSIVRHGTFVHVAMGTLVDDPSIRPTRHIFVGSKARWFAITDDLAQYQEDVVTARATGQPAINGTTASCPKCHADMVLAAITRHPVNTQMDRHTYLCAACNQTKTYVLPAGDIANLRPLL